MKLGELPSNGDWAAESWSCLWEGSHYTGTWPVGPGGSEPLDDVSAERIAEVIHWDAVSHDGYADIDLYAVVRLTDGQYAVCEAWADTTGFDCQGDAWWKVGPSLESVLAELSEVNRKRITDGGEPK